MNKKSGVLWIAHDQWVKDYVTGNIGPRNFIDANRDGIYTLQTVFENTDSKLRDDEATEKAREVLGEWCDGDVLLLAGHPKLVGICAVVAAEKAREMKMERLMTCAHEAWYKTFVFSSIKL